MKKIISINLGNFGSTGRIMKGISALAKKRGFITYQAFPGSEILQPIEDNDILICKTLTNRINSKLSYITGLNGCFALFSTFRLLNRIKKIEPDIIHFHNLHNSYINLPMLFRYIKKNNINVVWTLHDCWSFTGHCPYFTLANCNKWLDGCGKCSQLNIYPASLFDTSRLMWKLKRKWFTGVKNLTIVTPSVWLADLVRKSFLNQYPVEVIHNGINLKVFKPSISNFREKYNLQNKRIVLGVAFGWNYRKGLDVFIEISKRLDHNYQIVLVGTDINIDKDLPNNVISIHRTNNQEELAEIYASADVFVNPTREEVLGMVNVEALACGTPVITFNTGGSPECVDENCGVVIENEDIDELIRQIIAVTDISSDLKEYCLERARQYEEEKVYERYINLYHDVIL